MQASTVSSTHYQNRVPLMNVSGFQLSSPLLFSENATIARSSLLENATHAGSRTRCDWSIGVAALLSRRVELEGHR